MEECKKEKYIEYKNNQLQIINTVDTDQLNNKSEFVIGSLTKLFTMMIILILHKYKLLSVYDNVNKYVESNELNDFSKITIIQLLNHKSGMINILDDEYNLLNDDKSMQSIFLNLRVTDMLPTIVKHKLFVYKIGSKNYSSIAYILLGVIIEKVTQLTYMNAYFKFMLTPLKLNNTGNGITNIKLYNSRNNIISTNEYNKILSYSTSGSLHTCVNDLIIFAKSMKILLNITCLNILEQLYVHTYDENNKTHNISHRGKIFGGYAIFNASYDDNWKNIDVYVKLETVKDMN